VNAIVLTVIQILALNADNATSNDSQTTALAQMKNTFEEVNHACCFNHMLQLSAKTLLKPFNAGMSSTKVVLEDEESGNFDDEMPILLDNNAEGDCEGDDGDDGDEAGCDSGKDWDGDDEHEDNDSNEIDDLDQLDEQEHKKILTDMAVV
jgi:hypothetical protein